MSTNSGTPNFVDTDIFIQDVVFQLTELTKKLNENGFEVELSLEAPKCQGGPNRYLLEISGQVIVANNSTNSKTYVSITLCDNNNFYFGMEKIKALTIALMHSSLCLGGVSKKIDTGGLLNFRLRDFSDASTWVARDMKNNEITFDVALKDVVAAIAGAPDPRKITSF